MNINPCLQAHLTRENIVPNAIKDTIYKGQIELAPEYNKAIGLHVPKAIKVTNNLNQNHKEYLMHKLFYILCMCEWYLIEDYENKKCTGVDYVQFPKPSLI